MRPISRDGFNARWPMWCLALIAAATSGLRPWEPALGQQPRPFSTASLHGQYAVVGSGGDHAAASIGIETYDGQGSVTRSLVLNEPDATHTRKIVAITGRGTYRVQPNGMGTATIVNTLPDGSTFTSHLDFVVTRAAPGMPRGEKVATEVTAVLREPGVAASLVTFVLTRLPE